MKNAIVLGSSIIIAGAFIAVGVYLANRPVKAPDANTNAAMPVEGKTLNVRAISEADHIRGSKDASVVIVEYSDPECPFCKNFHGTLLQIMSDKNYSGKIAWVYRHFPLESLHKQAKQESAAMECAAVVGGNDAFWKFTDRLFQVTPSNDGLDLSTLPDIAEYAGLNRADFNTCITKGQTAAVVESDYQDAVAAGGTGTPYSVILGPKGQKIPVNGAVPLQALKVQLNSLLAGN